MNATIVYLLIPVLVVLVFFVLKTRKRKKPEEKQSATYGGAIRFTSPDGRNMKIIRKDDGSFETVEEGKD